MLEFVELVFDKVGDACVQGSVFVVPLECYANIFLACPVDCDIVPSFESALKMLGVALAYKFDAEIIDYKGEGDWAPHVLPQSCCELAWVVAGSGDAFRE